MKKRKLIIHLFLFCCFFYFAFVHILHFCHLQGCIFCFLFSFALLYTCSFHNFFFHYLQECVNSVCGRIEWTECFLTSVEGDQGPSMEALCYISCSKSFVPDLCLGLVSVIVFPLFPDLCLGLISVTVFPLFPDLCLGLISVIVFPLFPDLCLGLISVTVFPLSQIFV